MQKCTLTAIINAFNCVSDDETRYAMTNVLLTSDGKQVIIEATNGYCLSRVEIADDIASEIKGKRLLVSKDQLPLLKLIVKVLGRVMNSVPTAWVDGQFTIGSQPLTTVVVTLKNDGTDFKYPNLETIWPKVRKPQTRISFDPELLRALHKAMSDNTGSTKNVIIEIIGDDSAPLIIKCGENESLLMPVRIK